MGQEAGKPSWPRPAGGYQTTTGRRYGRRHAYVTFRPIPYKRRTLSSVDSQEVEMSSVQGEHATACTKGTIPSMIPDDFPVLSSNFVERGSKTKKDDSNRPPHSSTRLHKTECEKWRRDHIVSFDTNTCTTNGASAWDMKDEVDGKLASASVLSFVNIDSYEPDSSGGEEEGLSSEQTCVFQKKLDMICGLGKDFDDFDHSHACMDGDFCQFSDHSTKERLFKPEQGDTHSLRTGKTNGKCDYLGKAQSETCNSSTYSDGPCSCIDPECTSMQETVHSEMVVRPKVRKQTSQSHANKTEHSQVKEKESRTSAARSVRSSCSSVPTFDYFFDFAADERTVDRTKLAADDSKTKVNDDDHGQDDDFWEDLEDLEQKCASPEKGDESSVYSEGEWSASFTSDSGLEKEQRSSEESWETLPGLDELPSSSSSLEDIPPLSLTQEEQTPLEEGEIPWLRCNEDSGSSSDENPDSSSQFVHPGLFIMDSSNNLEDDSSMSEDLDTEWRLLDDFEEGFGMAQAISYVDHPQLLTYMALEERLAQAMEAALAHLESLAIDVEQAHPPASEQIIDSLPHIIVLDDHRGQEQSCAICCSEYVNEEIATQLPCRHMFHKLCVTLWLRKSGTCPVCRHVLTHLSEPTPFLSNQENPSSSPSAAGQTR